MNVLFVCTANGGRSVMAERLLRREADGRHAARSAGSNPGTAAHPQVLEALAEMGIDASDHVPRKLDDEAIAWADVVVATCDDACPVVPGKLYVAWQLPDPKNEPIERVREIRNDITGRVEQLVRQLDEAADHDLRGVAMPGAGENTRPVEIMNANWKAGADGDDGHFEVMLVTSNEQHHILQPSPAAMTALVALAEADTVLVWDPDNRTLIAANLRGTMPWTEHLDSRGEEKR